MGGLDSPLFERFVRAFTSGFLALRDNADVVLQTVGLLATDSPFPCMQGRDPEAVLDRLRGRLRKDLSVGACIQHCLDLVIESHGHYGTAQYDSFQWLTNGIVA
jgi:phosphatidylinositol kinase/protein kinase (PI-3  family)